MDTLHDYILSLGADLVGYADLSAISSECRFMMPYGISIVIALNPLIVQGIGKDASIEYFNEYQAVTHKLDNICNLTKKYILDKGYNAVAQTISFVQQQRAQDQLDQFAGKALVPHKTVAALAGLGWIGKSSLLVTPQYGSAVRLSSVLTDVPIEVTKATYKCLCGECAICSDTCPGSAIKNVTWDVNTDRDQLIDFYACRKAVKNRGLKLGKDHGACGICMAICPHTEKYLRRSK